MKKLLALCLVAIGSTQIAAAQDRDELRNEIRQQRDAIVKETRDARAANAKTGLSALTVADVGEPDSFGKNALFLGTAFTGTVFIDPTCDVTDVGTLGPDDRCITVADPSVQVPSTTFNDLGRITIPGKSVDNIIYAIGNNSVFYNKFNNLAVTSQARVTYTPSITIESVALNDPTLIDPTTGNPYNGSFTTSGFGSIFDANYLAPSALDSQTRSYTRANTNGFSRTYFASLGLPPSAINKLYKNPVTIKLNITVRSRFVESAAFQFSIRFLGN